MAADRRRASSCSTTRRAASTSAPSRRSTSCCASWPTPGAAILFYSTDYDELIGCCDRVLVLYDGAIVRELAGDDITEHALVAARFNLGAERIAARGSCGMNSAFGPTACANTGGTLLAFAACVVMFTLYIANHPRGLNANVATTAANKGVLLAIVAMAQTLVGADLGHRPVGRHGDGAGQLPGLAASSSARRCRRRSACVAVLAVGCAVRR